MDKQQAKQEQSSQVHNTYPVLLEVRYPEKSSRLLALLGIPWFFIKAILLIPHIIILYFLGIASMVVTWIAYWAILFTGKYPRGMFDFVVGVNRWQFRMSAWMFSLTDKYPPFSLK